MNKSLLSFGIATLLTSNSTALLASSVTIPNTFTSGTAAVAAEVNDNFTAVANAVNDNDGRITTNAGAVSTNTGNITANTDNITINTNNIGINTGNIATNTADIANLQTATSCSSDMAAVGSLCVDLYEASVWDAPTAGNQLNLAGAGGTDDILCSDDGSDCGATAANPIYARSVTGTIPAARITWYQAAQACANVGKRLPTLAEWQMAAQGTPPGVGAGCNAGPGPGAIANSGASATCVSSVGAFDMVGNVWEYVADVAIPDPAPAEFTTTDAATGYAMGEDFSNSSTLNPSVNSVFELDGAGVDAGLNTTNGKVGFRCVR